MKSYPHLLWSSIKLGVQSKDIGLGYLGGFVARASSVAISLFIPLFTNAYFLRSGLCTANPEDPSDIKNACPRAYTLAAALTGVSQLVALLCAPLFGYLAGRYQRFNLPLIIASAAGVAGYAMFGSLASPDPRSEEGSGGVFFVVVLLGISQMGAIVCSLGLLSSAIQQSEEERARENGGGGLAQNGNGATPRASRPETPAEEVEQPLLVRVGDIEQPGSSGSSESLSRLRGSIAGTYSLAGGVGILLLTKVGGALFDSAGPGAPFYMMAGFNALLLAVTGAVAVWEGVVNGDRDADGEGRLRLPT